MPVPCEECGRNMSPHAVVCPHCTHRQSDRDLLDPPEARAQKKPREGLSLSGEEVGALFEAKGISGATYEYVRPRGPIVLVLPRAEASGWMRALEWLLTFLSLPLLLGGFLLIALRPRMWRYVADGGELGLSLAAGLFGGLGMLSIAAATGWSMAAAWGLVGVSGGALAARVVVRSMRPS